MTCIWLVTPAPHCSGQNFKVQVTWASDIYATGVWYCKKRHGKSQWNDIVINDESRFYFSREYDYIIYVYMYTRPLKRDLVILWFEVN